MANAWIQHVKKTKEQYPALMQSGGLKAIIMKAKETYKKQSGGSGTPMGGTTESFNSEEVVGGRDTRVAAAGAGVENKPLENAHTMEPMTAGGKKKGKKGKTAKKSKKSKKGGKGKNKKSVKKNKSSKKSRKSRK